MPVITVKDKTPSYEALQCTGSNKAECDTFIGARSTAQGTKLIYKTGDIVLPNRETQENAVLKGQWIIKNRGVINCISDADFNRLYEAS